MALPLYLALTAAEFRNCSSLPEHIAWMSCHYSPYGLGLSNCPQTLPEGSMLILNDRTPPCGHDPALIARQLSDLVVSLRCSCVLLDFQRPDFAENTAVAKAIIDTLSCPVGVSESYARGLACPIFVPPVPLQKTVAEYIEPWNGREIWLDTALDGEQITVTEKGSFTTSISVGKKPECAFEDMQLHCHYNVSVSDEQAVFTVQRTQEDIQAILSNAEKYNITAAVGLWQELG